MGADRCEHSSSSKVKRTAKRYVGVCSGISEQFGTTKVDQVNLFGGVVHTHCYVARIEVSVNETARMNVL